MVLDGHISVFDTVGVTSIRCWMVIYDRVYVTRHRVYGDISMSNGHISVYIRCSTPCIRCSMVIYRNKISCFRDFLSMCIKLCTYKYIVYKKIDSMALP